MKNKKAVGTLLKPTEAVEAEIAILGSVLRDCKILDSLGDLPLEAFTKPENRVTFQLMAALHLDGVNFDVMALTAYAREKKQLKECGGEVYLSLIDQRAYTAGSVDYFLQIVRRNHAKNAAALVLANASEISGNGIAPEDVPALIAETIEKLQQIHGDSTRGKELPIEFFTPSQLRNFKPPEGHCLVGDQHIVHGEIFIIGGAGGIGKSRATVALAVAGATGKPWFGYETHAKFRTMIVQNENGMFRLSQDLRDLDVPKLDDYLRVCAPPPMGLAFHSPEFRSYLLREIRAFGPDLLVIDPWSAVASDDKQKEVKEAFDAIRAVVSNKAMSPAIGIVAHTKKPRAEERADGRALLHLLSGSNMIGTVPRCVFVLQAASNDTIDERVVWTCCKNNNGQMGARSAWFRRNGLFAPVPNFDWETFDNVNDKPTKKLSVAQLVEFIGEQRTVKRSILTDELIERFDVSKRTVDYALEAAFSEELIDKDKNGLIYAKTGTF